MVELTLDELMEDEPKRHIKMILLKDVVDYSIHNCPIMFDISYKIDFDEIFKKYLTFGVKWSVTKTDTEVLYKFIAQDDTEDVKKLTLECGICPTGFKL